ncbi:uncharacterized protein LOC135482327 [Liolophura sinensis]|uniref:uncharacterized protein LOC135482327 n=1 Tax=Liolophura sinensis TaxID=3198878 RepID=UPI003158EA88
MEIRLLMSPANRLLLLLNNFFASMLQIGTEDIVSVLGDDDVKDDLSDVLSFDRLSDDSNSSDFLSSLLSTEFTDDPYDKLVRSPETIDHQDRTQSGIISSVAELLSDDSVSYLVKESLRYKVSSRSSVESTTSSEHSHEPSSQHQPPTEEDQERKEKRRRFNREWAKRDRQRKKSREDRLQQKIEQLESENMTLEKEIADLKEEARELRACWHLHQVFYH